MESCASEMLTNNGPIEVLTLEAQPWKVASPQDQPLLSQLSPGCLIPLALLGEGAYGCVELCRVSVTIAMSPRDDCSASTYLPATSPHEQQRRGSNGSGEHSVTSEAFMESCGDPDGSHLPSLAADPSPRSITPALAAAGASEAVLSPRGELAVLPGRFSVNRLRVSTRPQDLPSPSPCATPVALSRPPAYLSRLHLHPRQGPARSTAPAASTTAGLGGGASVNASLAAGSSPAGAPHTPSGIWPAPPSSARWTLAAGGVSGASLSSGFLPRPCSSGSAAIGGGSAPSSARSPGRSQPQSSATAGPNAAAMYASAPAPPMRYNELVVAVKRIGYRGRGARSAGGGREPDGCAGSAVVRGRGGLGPSRVRLNRMQAIELLQMARCRECPFIVRVFGCVPDEPRGLSGSSIGAGGSNAVPAAPVARQSPRFPRLSPRRRPAQASASSPSSSCRIVMEWAEGGDLGSFLKALIARRGPCSDPSRERLLMSESSARFYLACLLEALSFLHGKGLLHRDVKPANLLLTSDGRAKLGDLGMVCHLDRDGTAVGRAGTPNYMAPEVWANGSSPKYLSYGANADLWSAGVTLYEMMTGYLPASHPDEYLRRNWVFTPCQTALGPELRDLLGRLLNPRPRRRPQTCAEVAAHPWFADFDWQGLRDGSLPAPYVPAAHRPPGYGAPGAVRCTVAAATAAVAAVARPWQVPGTALAASAVVGVGGIKAPAGGMCEPMPPLPEEHGLLIAADAATGLTGMGKPAAATLTTAALDSTAGMQQHADPAAIAPTAGRDSAAEHERRNASGRPSLECPAGRAQGGVEPSRPASPTAAAMGLASPVSASSGSVWQSLGKMTAPRAAPAGMPASAPLYGATSVSLASRGAWLRRGASHGSAYGRGDDGGGSAAATVSGGAARRRSAGGLGFWSTALSSALSSVVAAPPGAAAVSAQRSSGEESGATAGLDALCASSRLGSEGAFTVAAGLISASAGSCTGMRGGGRAAPAPASADSSITPYTTTIATASFDASALLLNTAASRAGIATTSDCRPMCYDSTITTATGSSTDLRGVGRVGCGGSGSSNSRSRGESMVWHMGSPCFQGGETRCPCPRPSIQMDVGLVAAPCGTCTAAATVAILSNTGGPVMHAAPQGWHRPPLSVPPGHRRKPYRRSAGGAVSSSMPELPHAAPGEAGRGHQGATCGAPRPGRPSVPVAPVAAAQSALLGALTSLQQHVQGLGPTGRRAGWWVQQRLADAAALAASLSDQLQAAAAAAAAVVGRGDGSGGGAGANAAMAAVRGRAYRSDGGSGGRGAGGLPPWTGPGVARVRKVSWSSDVGVVGGGSATTTKAGAALSNGGCDSGSDVRTQMEASTASWASVAGARQPAGTCEPATAASLQPGASLTCPIELPFESAPRPVINHGGDHCLPVVAGQPLLPPHPDMANTSPCRSALASWTACVEPLCNARREKHLRASSPKMLRLLPPRLPATQSSELELAQKGSNVATVHVVVRGDMACDGSANDGAAGPTVSAAAEACDGRQHDCGTVGSAAFAGCRTRSGSSSGANSDQRRENDEDSFCSLSNYESARDSDGSAAAAGVLPSSPDAEGPAAPTDLAAAPAGASGSSEEGESLSASTPQATASSLHPLHPHRRTSSFSFDPLDQGRPMDHASGSAGKSMPSVQPVTPHATAAGAPASVLT